MLVGILLALLAFGMRTQSYVFLSLVLVGYLMYYALRIAKVGRETPFKTRMELRGASLLVLCSGYVFLTTVGG